MKEVINDFLSFKILCNDIHSIFALSSHSLGFKLEVCRTLELNVSLKNGTKKKRDSARPAEG